MNFDFNYDKYMKLLTGISRKRKRPEKKSRMHELSHLPRMKITKDMPEFEEYFDYLSYSGKRNAKIHGWYWINFKKRRVEINAGKFFAEKAYVAATRAINGNITCKWLDCQYELQDILQDCVLRIYELSGSLNKFDHNSIMVYYYSIAAIHLKKYWKKEKLTRLIGKLNENFG